MRNVITSTIAVTNIVANRQVVAAAAGMGMSALRSQDSHALRLQRLHQGPSPKQFGKWFAGPKSKPAYQGRDSYLADQRCLPERESSRSRHWRSFGCLRAIA